MDGGAGKNLEIGLFYEISCDLILKNAIIWEKLKYLEKKCNI